MAKDEHNKAAEHHENAAKSHRAAAEHHGKGDHMKGTRRLPNSTRRMPPSPATRLIPRANNRSSTGKIQKRGPLPGPLTEGGTK
jgi:hypothetical protein